MKAISVRQPWAWLIVNGHKNIENRSRPIEFRGHVLIHASKTMKPSDYQDCVNFLKADPTLCHLVDILPLPEEFQLGGVVGEAWITDMIKAAPAESHPWYTGNIGYVLTNQSTLPFYPLKGQLGFFTVAELPQILPKRAAKNPVRNTSVGGWNQISTTLARIPKY